MGDSAKVDQFKDRLNLKKEDRGKMVEFLKKELSSEVKEYIKSLIKRDPDKWYVLGDEDSVIPFPFHMGMGMGIRNALRDEGFTETALGIVNLDNVYVEIVEESVK